MNTNTLKRFTSAAALGLVSLAALAGLARAESLSIAVPFAFTAAGKTLPAGSYTIDTGSGILLIHGATAAESAAFQASASGLTAPGTKPGLIFNRTAEGAVLSSVNMDSGVAYTPVASKRLPVSSSIPSKGSVALSHP